MAIITNIPNFAPSGFTAICEQCGKEFQTTPKATRGRFCSRRCWGDWLAVNVPRGEASPRYKQVFGRSALPPNPAILRCPICDRDFEEKPSHAHKRRCCSRKCYTEWMSDNGLQYGRNNPNWRGGESPKYYGPNWRPAQRIVRERDKVCIGCGVGPDELGRELDVHHLTPFRAIGVERYREANDLTNLIALCPACHKRWEHSGRRP